MIGIDTNVLIRLLVADDDSQTQRARRFIDACRRDEKPILVSLLVVVEAEWVLRSRYGFSKQSTIDALRILFETKDLVFEGESAVVEALVHWSDSRCGFSDCLIAAHHRRLGCSDTATFDLKAQASSGFTPVP